MSLRARLVRVREELVFAASHLAYLRGRLRRASTLVRERHAGAQDLAGARRVALLTHFEPAGRIQRHVRYALGELASAGFATVLVSNAPRLDPDAVAAVLPLTAAVLRRDNVGLDFGAWKDALALVDPSRLESLILLNDSVFGPLQPFASVLERLPAAEGDVWGITDSRAYGYHLQSYFLLFHARALASPAFREFWQWLPFVGSKTWTIRRCEIGLSQRLVRGGLRLRALCPYDAVAATLVRADRAGSGPAAIHAHRRTLAAAIEGGLDLNPSHFFWDVLLAEHACPYLKVALLRENPAALPFVREGWRAVLAASSRYDPALIDEVLGSSRTTS